MDRTRYNKLVKFLDSRDIKAVGLDVDNTLLHTGEYYKQAVHNIGFKIAPKIDTSKEPDIIAIEIADVIFLAYKKDGRKPRLIDEVYIAGLGEYINGDVDLELQEEIIDHFKDFYNNSPKPFDNAPEIIKAFVESNRKVVLHSHAQEEWTKIKVELLEELTGHTLKYLSTPIAHDKDSQSWVRAFEIVDTDINDTLVVGDNLEADILSAMNAGSKCLVWIDVLKSGLPEDITIDNDKELIMAEHIGDVLEKISNLH